MSERNDIIDDTISINVFCVFQHRVVKNDHFSMYSNDSVLTWIHPIMMVYLYDQVPLFFYADYISNTM